MNQEWDWNLLKDIPLHLLAKITKTLSSHELNYYLNEKKVLGKSFIDNDEFWKYRCNIKYNITFKTYVEIQNLGFNQLLTSEFKIYIWVITYLGYVETFSDYYLTYEEMLNRGITYDNDEIIEYALTFNPEITDKILHTSSKKGQYHQMLLSRISVDDNLLILGILGYDISNTSKQYLFGKSIYNLLNNIPSHILTYKNVTSLDLINVLKHKFDQNSDNSLLILKYYNILIDSEISNEMIYRQINDSNLFTYALISEKLNFLDMLLEDQIPEFIHPEKHISNNIIDVILSKIDYANESSLIFFCQLLVETSRHDLTNFQYIINKSDIHVDLTEIYYNKTYNVLTNYGEDILKMLKFLI